MRTTELAIREVDSIDASRAATFSIAPVTVARLLFAVLASLVVAHLVFSINQEYLGLDFFGSTILWVLFDLQGEVTVPTWFSASLLLACAGLFAVVAAVKRRVEDQFRWHWFGLAVIFLGLSIDEAADFHGAVSYKLQFTFDTSGVLAYPWILPAAILSLVVGLIYLRFLLQLPNSLRNRVMLAGALFLMGALALEAVEAAYDSAVGGDGLVYILMVAAEESLENAGVIILITSLLSYLGTIASELRLTFTHGE